MKDGIESPAVRRRLEEDEIRLKREANGEEPLSTTHSAIHRENEVFVSNQQEQILEMHRRQDQSLVRLGEAVDQLGEQGRVIKDELVEQDHLLNKLGGEIETGHEKMNVVQEALSKLLQTKDGCQIWTIVILGIVLILLSKFFGLSPLPSNS